jgi:hypothetical protein
VCSMLVEEAIRKGPTEKIYTENFARQITSYGHMFPYKFRALWGWLACSFPTTASGIIG